MWNLVPFDSRTVQRILAWSTQARANYDQGKFRSHRRLGLSELKVTETRTCVPLDGAVHTAVALVLLDALACVTDAPVEHDLETVFRPRKSTSSFFLLKRGVQIQYLFNQKPNTPF